MTATAPIPHQIAKLLSKANHGIGSREMEPSASPYVMIAANGVLVDVKSGIDPGSISKDIR